MLLLAPSIAQLVPLTEPRETSEAAVPIIS